MRVKAFRRLLSTLLDLNLLFLVVYGMFILFGRTIIENQIPNYEENHVIYTEMLEIYNDDRNALEAQFNEGSLSSEAYDTKIMELIEDFNTTNKEYAATEYAFALSTLFFFVFSVSLLNYFYNLALKGQTIGRRIMKIRLVGNVTWLSLLVREFLYKGLFWIATFGLGIIVDILMITFSKTRRTIRDFVTKTYLTHEGVNYPF